MATFGRPEEESTGLGARAQDKPQLLCRAPPPRPAIPESADFERRVDGLRKAGLPV